jgi:hypothetical protein
LLSICSFFHCPPTLTTFFLYRQFSFYFFQFIPSCSSCGIITPIFSSLQSCPYKLCVLMLELSCFSSPMLCSSCVFFVLLVSMSYLFSSFVSMFSLWSSLMPMSCMCSSRLFHLCVLCSLCLYHLHVLLCRLYLCRFNVMSSCFLLIVAFRLTIIMSILILCFQARNCLYSHKILSSILHIFLLSCFT